VGLSTGLSLIARTDGDDAFEVPIPSFSGFLSHRLPRLTLRVSASVDPEFVSTRNFSSLLVTDPDTGEQQTEIVSTTGDPLQIDSRIDASATYAVDPRNSLNAGLSLNRRDYDETSEDFQRTTRVTARGGWTRSVNRRTDVGLNGQLRYFSSEDPDDDDSVAATLTGNLAQRITTRHRMNLGAGLTAIDDQEDLTVSFTGNAGLSYQGETVNYSLSLGQDIRQDDDGTISNVLSLRGNINYTINERSSLTLGSTASTETDLEDGFDSEGATRFGISAGYNLALAEDWALQLSGGLQSVNDNDGSDTRSDARFFLRINRAFQFVP
jgi:hypothetical protein